MEDIDQNRFALMTAFNEAHTAHPDRYPTPEVLVAMSDEALRSYAAGVLHSLEATPASDQMATRLQKELRNLLRETR